MSQLKGLKSEATKIVLDSSFRNGTREAVIETIDVIDDLALGRIVRLEPVRAVIEKAMLISPREKSDLWLAPRLHATLRLTRREAADKRIWSYLTIAEFPEYVRWRWGKMKEEQLDVPMDRFIGEDSKNALARLWWAAELTRNGSDYSSTVKALSNSRFAVSWQHLDSLHHRAAALAIVDFLTQFGGKGTTDQQGQDMAKAFNLALRTLSLDSLHENPATDAEAFRTWYQEDIDETKMMDQSPTGPDESPVPPEAIVAVREVLDRLAAIIKLENVKTKRPSHEPLEEESGEIEVAVIS